MKLGIWSAAALTASATAAFAGGIDRSGQSVAVIFEKGDYAEFSFGSVAPTVSGVQTINLSGTSYAGASSGDMAQSYSQFSLSYKHSFGNGLDVAVIVDQPYGANVAYPAPTGVPVYFAAYSTAELDTTAITTVLKYTLPSNVSFFGGVRYETMSAQANIPFVKNYKATGETDGGFGYLIGVAWEKPEIAARIALTYNSKIKHQLATTETSDYGTFASTTTVNAPQSVNIEFQTGIAANTLLFGSVRWVNWSDFDITPSHYKALTGGSLVSYDKDTWSYAVGIGRKFNEHWAGSVALGYERKGGGPASNLGPTDGYTSISVGGAYTNGNVKISGGVRYVLIGDTYTQLMGYPASSFTGNHAMAAGVKIGVSF